MATGPPHGWGCRCLHCRRHGRDTRPARGILRNAARRTVQPCPDTWHARRRSAAARAPHNTPIPAADMTQWPVFHFSDGTRFTPEHVIRGRFWKQSDRGPPTVTPGYLPAIPLPAIIGTNPIPLSHITPPPFTPATISTRRSRTSHQSQRSIEWPPGSGTLVNILDVCDFLRPSLRSSTILSWDVRRRPNTAMRVNHRGNFFALANELKQPVTTPPSNSVEITCREGLLDQYWPAIAINGSSGPVTVEDVLWGIYNWFHTQITQDEYDQIKAEDSDTPVVFSSNLAERAIVTGESYRQAYSEGVRRIDTLDNQFMFGGLEVEYYPDRTWRLDLKLTDKLR